MNITQANNVIAVLNRVAELVTSLAADVESAAWEGLEDHVGMPGARPIAAAQLNMTMRKQKIRLRLKPQIWRFHLRMYAQFFLIFPVKD